MLFRYSDSRLDFETADADKMLDVNFWNINGKSQGVVRLSAKELEKLITHLNLQLSKMTTPAISQQPSKLKNKHQ